MAALGAVSDRYVMDIQYNNQLFHFRHMMKKCVLFVILSMFMSLVQSYDLTFITFKSTRMLGN